MAYIECGECGRTISDMAMTCPTCGRSIVALKAGGCNCSNCKKGDYEDGTCDRNYGPTGYSCLAYDPENYDYYDE